MNPDAVDKGLREAQFALDQMRAQKRRVFGDQTPFDYHLGRFLTAGRTIRGEFHYRQDRARNNAIKAWQDDWENKLGDKKPLYDFMREDRNHDIHEGGSTRDMKITDVNVGSHYSDDSGTLTSHIGLPGTGMGGGAIIQKRDYYFKIDGKEREVIEASAEYLELLKQMVADYRAAKI